MQEDNSQPRRVPLPARFWLVAGGAAVLLVIVIVVMVVRGRARGGKAIPSTGNTWTAPVDGMVMVYLPEGIFWMGSNDSDPDANNNEKPQSKVSLDAFWIDRTEVTNAQYAAFLNAQGSQIENGERWLNLDDEGCLIEKVGNAYRPKDGYAEHPVVSVTWYGAGAYCAWADRRLPTGAEWEKAARGTDRRIYPWGNAFDCHKGNFDDETKDNDAPVVPGGPNCDGYVRTAPVGSFLAGASPYGALDMAGNVSEWVEDWDGYGYYRPYNIWTWLAAQFGVGYTYSPEPSIRSDWRVVRGRSYSDQILPRAAYHGGDSPTSSSRYRGFRCARSDSAP